MARRLSTTGVISPFYRVRSGCRARLRGENGINRRAADRYALARVHDGYVNELRMEIAPDELPFCCRIILSYDHLKASQYKLCCIYAAGA